MIKDIKNGMKDFGDSIICLINTLLLSFVYIFGVGVTSLFAKLIGKRFLDSSLGKKSYWQKYGLTRQKEESYYRQF